MCINNFIIVGAPVISEEISFKALTIEDAITPMFTLTFTSSGGPASSVVWTRDCVPLPSDTKHVLSLTLLDQESATYQHSLTVTDGASGVYKCIVINGKGSASVAMNFTSIQLMENDPPPEVISQIECELPCLLLTVHVVTPIGLYSTMHSKKTHDCTSLIPRPSPHEGNECRGCLGTRLNMYIIIF